MKVLSLSQRGILCLCLGPWASFGFVQLRSVLLTCLLIICALGHQFTPALRRWYLGMHRFAFPIILHTSNLFQHALFIAVLRCLDEPLTLPYIVSRWSPRLFQQQAVTKAMREFTAAYRYRFLLTIAFAATQLLRFKKTMSIHLTARLQSGGLPQCETI